jgi:hypothetical protein
MGYCHYVALFGYSKHQLSLSPPLSSPYNKALLSKVVNSWRRLSPSCSIERATFIEQRNFFYITELEN